MYLSNTALKEDSCFANLIKLSQNGPRVAVKPELQIFTKISSSTCKNYR